jgi:hypothetical protein
MNDRTALANTGNDAWRVEVLNDETAGTGVFPTYNQRFTLADEWSYGIFRPQACCELPGKRFVARASGEEGCSSVHLITGLSETDMEPLYRLDSGPVFVACQVQAPERCVEGGRFVQIQPTSGSWSISCNAFGDGEIVWTIACQTGGTVQTHTLVCRALEGNWIELQLALSQDELVVELNGERSGPFAHDPYPEPFGLRFGSAQEIAGGQEVVSTFRIVYVSDVPFLFKYAEVPQGPEDIRPGDGARCDYVCPATHESPRHSEGDLIELRNGNLLLAWSEFATGKAQDWAPSRVSAKISTDRGNTWGPTRVIAERDPRFGHPTPNVSLVHAGNGDLIVTYTETLPDGMKGSCGHVVLRRSEDDGETWSEPVRITPDTGNAHMAKLFCRMGSGRILLCAREYQKVDRADFGGVVRWPYALYSDDDGRTWTAGAHVPDPELSERLTLLQNVNEPSIAELADGRLLMTMRSFAGGQFFSYSENGGEEWTKPELSPLRGGCSPATICRIPETEDILAVWNYAFGGRAPLHSAVSSDGGRTWRNLKLIERSKYYNCNYVSITFIDGKAFLTYDCHPLLLSLVTLQVDTDAADLKLTVLPIEWFYRKAED